MEQTKHRRLGSVRASARAVLGERLREVSEGCTECMACAKDCAYLDRYGSPKRIAEAYDPGYSATGDRAYECSLCGLCTAACPAGLDPAGLHLEMRREAVNGGKRNFAAHRGILAYERRGTSRRYTLYALPPGCDTVFFPGCALSGTRPDKVLKLLDRLGETIPNLGIVLDCCTKPSRDLGREAYFRAMFGEMRGYLLDRGIRRVLAGCPNCYTVWREHGDGLEARSIVEVLRVNGQSRSLDGTVTIHDPCVVRLDDRVQRAARDLLAGLGLSAVEMRHSGRETLCCGEGGAVGSVNGELSSRWAERRKSEAGGLPIVTYCAGCAQNLDRHTPTLHLVDLVLEPEAAMAGRSRVPRAPVTYWNRLRLKRALRRRFRGAVVRERTYRGKEDEKTAVGP